LAGSLAGPLLLSFDRKVAFFKKWKFLFPAMVIPALFYIVWDILFTRWAVWSFNEEYISGLHLFDLPIEEVLFFFVVPYCCLFIYECIITYFPAIKDRNSSRIILYSIGFAGAIVGLILFGRIYTSTTFIFLALFIAFFLRYQQCFPGFNLTAFLISYLVILIPFMAVNGLLTAIPVVLYNDAENLGVRVYTIPAEDAFYGMLLIFMNVLIYEKLKERSYNKLAAASSKNQ
jgi:lycopene cyclase domain-containing protein